MQRGVAVLLALAIVGVGCGASESDVRSAKAALYKTAPEEMYELAKQVVTDLGYAVGEHDDAGWKFTTQPKFFGPEGDSETPGAEGFVHLRDGSVQVQFNVQVLVTAERKVAVLVSPVAFQKIGWSPKPRELGPDDPYLPQFVNGRADAIVVEIHSRARSQVYRPAGVR